MIYYNVEELINHALKNLNLDSNDLIYKRNILWDILNLDGINELPEISDEDRDFNLILDDILNYALDKKIVTNDYQEHLVSKLMGELSLKPSEIIKYFNSFKNKKDATNWFYKYCIDNKYVDYRAISKNIEWYSLNTAHPLKITINLSKPEKSNEEIRRLASVKKSNYPVSLIAKENVGYKGSLTRSPRYNIRTIPLNLNDENWFFQYSPYGYFNEHLIAINNNYTPMIVNSKTVKKLLDFVSLFPHYFIGSNASLPIIGGSILDHEHYQGGNYLLPMFKRGKKYVFESHNFKDVNISIVDWYNSALRLTSSNKESLEILSSKIIEEWEDYSNPSINIVNKTNDDKHNSTTVIAYYKDNEYVIDLIFRNNRTDNEHKQGIFHANEKYFNIKSEGIGLIEATGLFILPARLNRQLDVISNILINKDYNKNTLSNDMEIHFDFIDNLLNKYKNVTVDETNSLKIIKDEINLICENILKDVAVFKPTNDGYNHFKNFLESINIIEVK